MGIGESIKGKVKEQVGDVTNNDELEAEGQAQDEKGQEEARATKAKTEAKAHEGKAESLEQEQKSLEDNA